MTTRPLATSKWNLGHTAYTTPDGTIVRLWNGPALYISRNTEQQREQAKRVKERGE